MNKKNIIITIIFVLILTCTFAFARTTTTDLGLVKPTWTEDIDILADLNANSDILEAFANDVLEFDLSPVLRANLDIATFSIEGVDATEFGYLDGVTSDIQTQFGLYYLKTEMDSSSELAGIISDETGSGLLVFGTAPTLSNVVTDIWLSQDSNTFFGVGVAGAGNLEHTVGDTGYYNTAIGADALYANTTGYRNTAIGGSALRSNTTGADNFGMGYYALYSNTTGLCNSAIGTGALSFNTTGQLNTAIGNYALYTNTTGYYNTAIGADAGRYQADGSTALTSPYRSIYIGYNSKGKDNSDSNSIVIGYNAIGVGANTVVLGNDSITKTILKGNVMIGLNANTPTARLHLAAGTAAASTAPLKFTSGTLLTAEEAGAIEFLTDAFYGTITTGPTRKQFAFTDIVDDTTYGAGWDTVTTTAPSKNAVYDKIEALPSGYTNLTSFVDQTAWRVFYSNTDGDVVELALGTDGTYLKSNGAAAAPTFATPSGSGDVVKVGTPANDQVGVWTGDGTIEGHASFTYASGTGTVTATQFVGGGAGVTGVLKNTVEDTTPELGGEMDAGAHSIGFTQQSTTGDGTTTIDWKLGNKFKFTFGAQNDTFTFTAPTNPCNILLMLIQDGTGSRLATWPGTVKWAGGTAPTLTTGAGTIDICSFYYDGTNYFGVASLAFAIP